MKKLLILSFFTSLISQAQDRGLKSLVEAERSFSKMSADKNLKEAFVNYFSPHSVDIVDGKEVNGLEHAKEMKIGNLYIVWEPNFADISSSGDFGYTTGPVRFYRAKGDSAPFRSIYYSTVWQKQAGEWKVIFDLGSSVTEADPPALEFSKMPMRKMPASLLAVANINNVMQKDSLYTALINRDKISVAPSFFSVEGRILRPNRVPVRGSAIAEYKDPAGRAFAYSRMNARIAASGDMAFTYGTVVITNTTNASASPIPARYYRVWKLENGLWHIVLDVLG